MKYFTLLLAIVFAIQFSFAQQLAFPTAEGAGKFTKGGRGTTTTPTTIFYVTNLNDDGLVGCLRYALTTTATSRTVVFTVSGTIHLNSNLSIKSNTTIAGQTAPAGGICTADHNVSAGGNNIIVRYMHFRLGDKNQNKGLINGSGGDDAFSSTGRKNIIIDHCTFSWSDDESCSVYAGDSTTIQWCMMSEPLNYSYHFETGDADFEHHGYGGIWGGRTASFHHNLFAHCQGRACRFDGSRNLDGGTTAGKENCDFSNNVLYNWGAYNVNGGEGGNYNIQNNYYKYGPNTSVKNMVINPYITAPLPYGKYFVTGNYINGYTSVTNNNWLGAKMNGGSLADTVQSKVTTAFPLPAINLQSATDAYNAVIASVGASIPARDTLEERIITNVKNRTGAIIDCQGGYPHGTAYSLTVNAWPILAQGNTSIDTDGDAMPDWWEIRNGLNKTLASDRAIVATNGYTNLENYLDSIPAWNSHANFESFTGTKVNSTLAHFTFSTAWVKDSFTYSLFRSPDSLGIYTKIADVSSSMNNINFTIDDNTLPATTVYYKVGSYKIGVTPDTLYTNIIKIEGIITPVKMQSYELRMVNEKQVQNLWTTATEVNVSYFNIQRSINNKDFKTVGTIAAKGFGSSYEFDDAIKNIETGIKVLYYRLEIIDKDGSKTYSEIKSLTISNKLQTINIFPNPAKNNFTITHPTAQKNTFIKIINAEGKLCYTAKAIEGSNATIISNTTLAAGNYVVIFGNESISTEEKLIIIQ